MLKESESQGTLELIKDDSIEISSNVSDLSEVVESFVTTQPKVNLD